MATPQITPRRTRRLSQTHTLSGDPTTFSCLTGLCTHVEDISLKRCQTPTLLVNSSGKFCCGWMLKVSTWKTFTSSGSHLEVKWLAVQADPWWRTHEEHKSWRESQHWTQLDQRFTASARYSVDLWAETMVNGQLTLNDSREDWRLTLVSAVFVDVIHSDSTYFGAPKPTGTVDFWPNLGRSQPGCPPGGWDINKIESEESRDRKSASVWWVWFQISVHTIEPSSTTPSQSHLRTEKASPASHAQL